LLAEAGVARVYLELVDGRVLPLALVEVGGERSSGSSQTNSSASSSEPISSLAALVRRLEAAAAGLEFATTRSKQPEGQVWLTHVETCERLRVHGETVKAAMLRSENHGLNAPWVNVGSEARPRYRWRADEVDAWWTEVHGAGKVRKRGPSARQNAGTGGLRALLEEGGK